MVIFSWAVLLNKALNVIIINEHLHKRLLYFEFTLVPSTSLLSLLPLHADVLKIS